VTVGLFRRQKGGDQVRATRVFYASDIHGSEILWRKFLNAAAAYRADTLVMGGDVTGKAVVPLVEHPDGYHVQLFGQSRVVAAGDAEEMEHRIRANGMYPLRMTVEAVADAAEMGEAEKEEWFAEVMQRAFAGWLALADERLDDSVRCFVMPGNDDPAGVDDAIERAGKVEGCDGRIVEFGDYTMLSMGYANRTPFDSPRELDESELYDRIAALADEVDAPERCVFNLHVPPYHSTLDVAPELTEELEVVMAGAAPKMIPVGSTAVREAIERYQPLLSLHGHVHESPGATKIGRTLCVNPGSEYHTGRLSGCVLTFSPDRVTHQFVRG
jgi:Icc-related predicted phosphoesterase